jgi:preprotein translocase subunit SecG
MGIIRVLLTIVEAACAILLIGVILLQKSKSEGLGMAFGSGMGETLFGSRAGNVLTKITITLGITFLVTTTLLAFMSTSSTRRSLIDERVSDTPMGPQSQPSPAPMGGISETPAAAPGAPLEAPSAVMPPSAPVAPVEAPAGLPSEAPAAP